MRNKIPCSAERLGLLDPQMIQAVSEASAFQIAQQYLTENRVRIAEADDAQITAAVIGNAGLYEQTIRLKDGLLLSKCSCTLAEEPMCRHCIGVLLEYHRWSQPKPNAAAPQESPPPNQTAPFVSRKTAGNTSSIAEVKLSDVVKFMEWLPSATTAIQTQGQLPDPPQYDSSEVSAWTHAICQLAEGRRTSDQAATRLRAEMRDRETYVQRVTQELQISMDAVKAAQMTVEELRLKIANYEDRLTKVVELATKLATSEEQLQQAASDLLQPDAQLERLTGSVKEIAQTLIATAKPIVKDSE
ncbi:MAG: hypothetical protein KF890_05020 [Nitrospira sp.]|nr:hypothetical protein [Nitrospira sp.]